MLDNVKIILVGTSHPGNIGSAARAMKTMGLKQLCLVAPRVEPDGQSVALAAGASDILRDLTTYDSLQEATADCGLVIGTSARSRTFSWPMLDAREAGEKVIKEGANYPVAVVFGRENHGLSNEELQLCQFHLCIPANPEYSSLNLAQAVQILCYEVRMAHLASQAVPTTSTEAYPLAEELERFYVHLESTLKRTNFIIKNHPGSVMTKLRRLFNRARPEASELNILRGILSSIERSVSETEDADKATSDKGE